MADYILYTISFILFLGACLYAIHPQLDTLFGSAFKELKKHIPQINTVLYATYHLGAIAIFFLFPSKMEDDSAWNRKTTGYIVIVAYLFSVGVIESMSQWAFFYEKAEKDEKYTKRAVDIILRRSYPIVFRSLFFSGYVITLVAYLYATRVAGTELPNYNMLVSFAALIFVADSGLSRVYKGAYRSSLKNINKIVKGRKVDGLLSDISGFRFTNTNGSINSGVKISLGDEIMHPNSALGQTMQHLKRSGKFDTENTETQGVILSTKGSVYGSHESILNALGPLKHTVHPKKITFNADTGAQVYTYDLTETGKGGYALAGVHPIVILAFVVFHLSWSIIFFESPLKGSVFWLVSNYIPLFCALTEPLVWWTYYRINQLLVFAILWLYGSFVAVGSGQQYLYENMETSYNASVPADVVSMDLVLENADPISAIATGLAGVALILLGVPTLKRLWPKKY